MLRKLSFVIVITLLISCGGSSPMPLADIDIPFSGERVDADIDGDPYVYFRYDGPDEVQADLDKVSEDVQMIDGKAMPWNGPVSVYATATRTVIYVGENEQTIKTIEQVFGQSVVSSK